MRDKDLYARILGIETPWRVAEVELNLQKGEVVVEAQAARCGEDRGGTGVAGCMVAEGVVQTEGVGASPGGRSMVVRCP